MTLTAIAARREFLQIPCSAATEQRLALAGHCDWTRSSTFVEDWGIEPQTLGLQSSRRQRCKKLQAFRLVS